MLLERPTENGELFLSLGSTFLFGAGLFRRCFFGRSGFAFGRRFLFRLRFFGSGLFLFGLFRRALGGAFGE